MFNLNRILNRKAENEKSENTSENSSAPLEKGEAESIVSGDEGFLCPSCLAKFPSADILQNHYETNHSDNLADGGKGRVSCICSVCKMILGSEIELKSHYQRHHTSIEKSELDALHMQTKVLEEGKKILHSELETLYKQLSEQIKETSIIAAQKLELEQENDRMSQLITRLTTDNSELKEQYANLDFCFKNSENEVHVKNAIEKMKCDLKSKVDELTKTLNTVIEDSKTKESEYNLARRTFSELQSDLTSKIKTMESEIQTLTISNKALISEKDKLLKTAFMDHEALEQKIEYCSKLDLLVKELQSQCHIERNATNKLQSDLTSKIQNMELEIQNLTILNRSLISEKDEMLKTASADHETLEQKIEQCSKLDLLVKDLQSQCHIEKNATNKVRQDLDDAKQILVESNQHFEKEKQSLNEKHFETVSSLNSKIRTLESTIIKLNESNTATECQITELQEQLNKSVNDSLAAENLFTTQMQLVNENVAVLKSALSFEEAKQIENKTKVDELSGIKLELEAKLENTLDERKALLARCLSSEAENEKLREKSVGLRKKLDDNIVALQELGRENQTLQLEIAKFCERKWADDTEVTNCSSCEKPFSVTVRKHHCRNCGKIFCNECSSKSAAIAAWKNPVRVCTQCYEEISK